MAVWNDDDGRRSIDIAVVGEALGRRVDRTVALPAGTYYRVELLEPDRHPVWVQQADCPRYEFQVASTAFNCNDHYARLRASWTGLVEYNTTVTAVACGSRPMERGDGWTPPGA